MGNKADLTPALDAALTPSIATAPANKPIMDQLWNKIANPVKSDVQRRLDTATTQSRWLLASANATGYSQR